MKFGPRKPNFKKRVKARTTGRMKRSVKRSVNPLYGKKGMGWVNNPKKAAYNKIYNKTTFDAFPSSSRKRKTTQARAKIALDAQTIESEKYEPSGTVGCIGCLGVILFISSFFNPILFALSIPMFIFSFKKMDNEEKMFNQKQEQKKEEDKKLLAQLTVIENIQELNSLIDKAEKTNNVDTFFNYFEQILDAKEKSLYALRLLFANGYVTENDDLDKEITHINDSINQVLINFIKSYENVSFERATRLKTESGQRNNYKRSYDDLLDYSHYFSTEIKDYIEVRWQEI